MAKVKEQVKENGAAETPEEGVFVLKFNQAQVNLILAGLDELKGKESRYLANGIENACQQMLQK